MNDDTISRQAAIDAALTFIVEYCGAAFDEDMQKMLCERLDALPSAQPERQHGRIFNGIVVEYPSINTYPEYEGKPYFSIKYTENGQGLIGYGTYNPEVLSEYLKEYFMPSAQPGRKRAMDDTISRADAIEQIQVWAVNLANPKMLSREDAIYILESMPSANKSGHWVMNPSEVAGDGYYICSNCNNDVYDATDFCPNCGSYNGGGQSD